MKDYIQSLARMTYGRWAQRIHFSRVKLATWADMAKTHYRNLDTWLKEIVFFDAEYMYFANAH